MSNVVNIDAESGANLIGDDSDAALTIENSSTGSALKLDQSGYAANATGGAALELVSNSIASQAMLKLTGAQSFISVSTIKFITGGTAGTGAFRVVLPDGRYAWIPLLPDAAVTGIAV